MCLHTYLEAVPVLSEGDLQLYVVEMSCVLLHMLLDPSMNIARMHAVHSLAVTSTECRSSDTAVSSYNVHCCTRKYGPRHAHSSNSAKPMCTLRRHCTSKDS